MPSGGVLNPSVGLRLQAQSPGVTDVGNAHVSGNLIANTYVAAYGGYNDTGSGFSTPLVLGNYGTQRWTSGGLPNNTTVIGNAATVGSLAGFGNTSVTEQTLIGGSVNSGSRGNTVVGAAAIADANAATLSAAVGFHVVIGRTASSTSDFTNNRGLNVVIGANSSAVGGCITAIGAGQNINGKSGAGSKGGIYIGQYVVSGSGQNQIILDTRSTGGTTLPDETRSNLIKIGDSTHTVIEIAGRDFSSIGGVTRLINDANATVVSTDSALLYSAITAARTVTLPAANAVPVGFRILVSDASGSASGVNTITLNRAGADTINGGASVAINAAYGCRELVSDGVSKWTVIRSI